MICLILFSVVLVATTAQRPYFAGLSPIGYPTLASRFRSTTSTSDNSLIDVTTPSANSSTANLSSSNVFQNRIETNNGIATTIKIPVDARGDAKLVQRLNQWPREHRPYWLLNAEHIEKFRNTPSSRKNIDSITNRNSINTERKYGFFNYIPVVTEEPDDSFFAKPEPYSI